MNLKIKLINAVPLMERLRAAIAFGNEKGLTTDELEQVLADIEGMEELLGTDCISRQAAIMDAESWVAADKYEKNLQKKVVEWLKEFPPAELDREYARAVRNWLVNYQVKCADLAGRYTPYEVLGWIVSDWRKENGIW